jgi:hypothetical protein
VLVLVADSVTSADGGNGAGTSKLAADDVALMSLLNDHRRWSEAARRLEVLLAGGRVVSCCVPNESDRSASVSCGLRRSYSK